VVVDLGSAASVDTDSSDDAVNDVIVDGLGIFGADKEFSVATCHREDHLVFSFDESVLFVIDDVCLVQYSIKSLHHNLVAVLH
jgi:hypothetical protein